MDAPVSTWRPSASWSAGGSGAHAANAADFGGSLPTGNVSFAAGETTKTITVNVAGDTLFENDEGFTLSLTNPSGATITTGTATGSIANDDTQPTTCFVVARPGPRTGLSPTNDLLTGPADHNSFFVSVPASSGHDEIVNFRPSDVFVTDRALYDGNRDGSITFGSGGLLHPDGPGGSDSVKFDGLSPDEGLRFLGQSCPGTYVYADATVRPDKAMEGSLSSDALQGDAGDHKTDVFFYDTALGISLGDDVIKAFGAKDLVVTTTALHDGNRDGIINFGADEKLDLPGDKSIARTGTISIEDLAGKTVSSLQFEGHIHHGESDYYVYGALGGSGGADDVFLT